MVIPINAVSLDSAADNILPEVTDIVDNIDDRTPWSLNVATWYFSLLPIDQREESNIE